MKSISLKRKIIWTFMIVILVNTIVLSGFC